MTRPLPLLLLLISLGQLPALSLRVGEGEARLYGVNYSKCLST